MLFRSVCVSAGVSPDTFVLAPWSSAGWELSFLAPKMSPRTVSHSLLAVFDLLVHGAALALWMCTLRQKPAEPANQAIIWFV